MSCISLFRKPCEYSVNLAAIISVPLALILGILDVVDWWVIILIAVSHLEVNLTFRRKKKWDSITSQ